MKVLITSGGTKVPLDPARDITNMSSGTFGAEIAKEFLKSGIEVVFLTAKGAKTPMSCSFDFNQSQNWLNSTGLLTETYAFAEVHRIRYFEHVYKTYDQYFQLLHKLVCNLTPDIVILVAAVSDYLADYHEGKIRSQENLVIKLTPAPKIINKIKEWCPSCFLVGFKLLTNGSKDQLIEASLDSIHKNKCDLVVANDLSQLKSGHSERLLVSIVNGTPEIEVAQDAEVLMRKIIERQQLCGTSFSA